MGCSCVPAFPVRPINPVASEVLHPLPIDLGEVRKLCKIEEANVGGDLEGVCETRWKTVLAWAPTNTDPSTGAALRVTTAAGLEEVSPLSLRKSLLAYPNWERLGPSVVIRRRPVRVQGLGIS